MKFASCGLVGALFSGLTFVSSAPESNHASDSWERLYEKDGLVISQLEIPGEDLPRYRARGVLPVDMYSMLAVLNDFSRHREWMRFMSESRVISRDNDFRLWMYVRFDAPWPVWDRDAVLKLDIQRDPQTEEVWMTFSETYHPAHPKGEDVIRLPRFDVRMNLRPVDEKNTFIDYLQDIRPGGDLPNWVVRWLSRRVPVETIDRLRLQIEKTKGEYDQFQQKFNPRHKMEKHNEAP